MNEIDLYRGASLDDRWKYTQTLAAAQGLLPTSVTQGAPQAVAARTFFITETGDMLGIHPLAAIQGVNVIEGKPSLAPALMSALVRRAGHKVRVLRRGQLAANDYAVEVQVVRADDPDFTFSSTWDVHRAIRAGLVQKYEPGTDGIWRVVARSQRGYAQPWEKYTEAMLYARALAEVCREAAEDVLFGVHYTPEELGANVDGEGNAIDVGEAQVAASAPEPTAMPSERQRATNGAQGVRRAPSVPAPAPDASEAAPEPPAAASTPEPQQDDRDLAAAAVDMASAAARIVTGEPIDASTARAVLGEPVDAEVVPDEPGPGDEGPAAVLDEQVAEPEHPAAPTAFEVALAEEPTNWSRLSVEAATIEDLQTVWYAAEGAQDLNDDLKRFITAKVQKIRQG